MLFWRSHLLNDCGMAPATVNRHIAAMRSLAKLARQLGFCTWTLETQGVKAEKRRQTMGPAVEQVRGILAATSGDTEAETRDSAIVVVLFCCGLRISELCGLEWADVDLDRAQAWLRKSKGKREKVLIELPTAVVDAIHRYAKHRGTDQGPLFQTRGLRGRNRDGRLETRSAGRIVRELGAKIGIHLWPHALRHSSLTTAAAEGAKAGFSLNDVRVHSRHASVLTLQGYIDVHNAARTRRAIVDLVANALTATEASAGAKVEPNAEPDTNV
jgi:integrase/recombinase XerC